MKLKKCNNTDHFEVSGTLVLFDFKETGILKSDGSNYQLSFNTSTKLDFEENIQECQFITVKGETLYLRNGILSHHSRNFPGSNEFEYLFTQIWVSISHLEIPDTFDSVSVKFSGLKENINHTPFNIGRDKTHNKYTISIDNANLKKEIISLDKVHFSSICKTNCKLNRFNEITFYYENLLKFQYENNLTSEKCISDALNIAYIFSFITNEKHKIESIILYSKEDAFKVFVNLPLDFQEYHKTSITHITKNFLYKYLANIYSFFYNNHDSFEDIFSNYIKLMYTPKFIEHYLVDLLKINEGLHRRFVSNQQINLVERYKDLFYSLDDELQSYLKSIINYDETLHDYLKNYRHYYSHYFPLSEKPIYPKDNLINTSNYVLQLHKSFIMFKIGIPSNEIIDLLKITH
ncbi:ApeA-like protein/HEPN superfamily Apea-like protein [Staphylococcus caledonicus]|uniref:ApeA N-terminal domain 1-containing protein n=1 Tax=Staphylococcus caledonicus TaxID=2741333 RepID=UPI003C2B6648